MGNYLEERWPAAAAPNAAVFELATHGAWCAKLLSAVESTGVCPKESRTPLRAVARAAGAPLGDVLRWYVCRAELPLMKNRGDAAAATWTFHGDELR